MSVALAALAARLSNDVPARDDVPTATQYENCVREAVADYSRRNSFQRVTTISVVSGTADYDLPSDFLRVIKFTGLTRYDGVIIGDAGLIPVGANFEERVMVRGRTLTISPTPTYSQNRDLWYAAGHVLDDSDEYPEMTEEDAGVLMLLAQAKALGLQANKASHDAWQYAIGDERVNKERLADSLRAQAEALEVRYREAVAGMGGAGRAWGVRAPYSQAARARWV